MGCCCSNDLDSKTSWSPEETKDASRASTIIAQPMENNNGTFKKRSPLVMTMADDAVTSPPTIETETTTTTKESKEIVGGTEIETITTTTETVTVEKK